MSDNTDTRLYLVDVPYTGTGNRTAELVYFDESALPTGDGDIATAETKNAGTVNIIPGSFAHDYKYSPDSMRYFNGTAWTNKEGN